VQRPDGELLEHRPVEAELGADLGDRLGRGILAGAKRIRKKTKIATTAITGRVAKRRRTMYAVIRRARRPSPFQASISS
jgi:hypothetical protein